MGAYGHDGSAGTSQGTAYVFERVSEDADGLGNWTQIDQLFPSDAAESAVFGLHVSISNETIVVGSDEADGGKGAAYVFEKFINVTDDSVQFKQTSKLIRQDDTRYTSDEFGYSVDIDAYSDPMRVIIGARKAESTKGRMFIFEKFQNDTSSNGWNQTATFSPDELGSNEYFGFRTGISGDYAIASSYYHDDKGAAWIYVRNDGNWSLLDKVTANDIANDDYFGCVCVCMYVYFL